MSYIRKFRTMMLAAVFAVPAYAQDLLGRSVAGTGGIGYSVQHAEYRLVDDAWVQIAGKRLKQAPPLAPTAGTRPAAEPPR